MLLRMHFATPLTWTSYCCTSYRKWGSRDVSSRHFYIFVLRRFGVSNFRKGQVTARQRAQEISHWPTLAFQWVPLRFTSQITVSDIISEWIWHHSPLNNIRKNDTGLTGTLHYDIFRSITRLQTVLLHSTHCKHQFRILQYIIFVYTN